ncbi:hypothetical protein [Paraburkholderia bannensis]|uniref:hypothetical protein n=1 Tax=Paraburkholderia bannensis TaxID=765414 RepID=UPI002AB24557|nr:hypothetical protein [Paraburkholderia bannensis]
MDDRYAALAASDQFVDAPELESFFFHRGAQFAIEKTYGDIVLEQLSVPLRINGCIRIQHADHDLRDARLDEQLGARPDCLAIMKRDTWFERRIDRSATPLLIGELLSSNSFCVKVAALASVSCRQYDAVFSDDRIHSWKLCAF